MIMKMMTTGGRVRRMDRVEALTGKVKEWKGKRGVTDAYQWRDSLKG